MQTTQKKKLLNCLLQNILQHGKFVLRKMYIRKIFINFYRIQYSRRKIGDRKIVCYVTKSRTKKKCKEKWLLRRKTLLF